MLSQFALELWIKYAVAMAVMIFRFGVRITIVGLDNFDGTDLWCAISTACYTIVSACDYVLNTPDYPTNIGMNPESALAVPPEDVPLILRGSRIAHFSWTIYICMIFSFKGVMMSIFRRVTTGIHHQEKVVLWAIVLIVASWVASVLAHLLPCIPGSKVGQLDPWPGAFCTTRPQNYYVAGILNMVTDLIIIIIPMPMLWALNLPLRRKLALGALFSSGIFVIICTILRTYYSLASASNQYIAQQWAGREGFVSMVVISAPGIYPIFHRLRLLGSSSRKSYHSETEGTTGLETIGGSNGRPGGSSARRWGRGSKTSKRSKSKTLTTDEDEGEEAYTLTYQRSKDGLKGLGSGESEEQIVKPGSVAPTIAGDSSQPITVTTEYTVEFENGHSHSESAAMAGRRHMNWE